MVEQIVTSGDFQFDFHTGRPVSRVGQRMALDPEIANEGQKAVILSDGDVVSYNPPSVKAVIPDWSEIKSIKHYFHRTGYRAWPAWFYHPDGHSRLFKDAQEASGVGITLRAATFAEKGQYGRDWVWDISESVWSPIPYPGTQKFDPNNVGQGKTYVASPPNPRVAQNELLAELIPTVVAAVTTALKGGGAMNAPPSVDPKEWDEFLAFQAFKKTQEALGEDKPKAVDPERAEWEAKAKDAGIKVDGRWSLVKLREHVAAELEKRSRGLESQSPDSPGLIEAAIEAK